MVRTARTQSTTIAMGERGASRGTTRTTIASPIKHTTAPIQRRTRLASRAACLLGMVQAPGEVGLQVFDLHAVPVCKPSQVLIASGLSRFSLDTP